MSVITDGSDEIEGTYGLYSRRNPFPKVSGVIPNLHPQEENIN